MKKLFLSILLTFILTFAFSQTVIKSGGEEITKNKTTKVILNAVNGSVRIHKHVLEGTGFGYGSGSAWNDDLGYISTRTTTTVNTSTTEYLCNTPAELTVDRPVKLSIGGYNDYSFVINPTGGTQYWDVRAFDSKKYDWGWILALASLLPIAYSAWDIYEGIDYKYIPVWGIVSGAAGLSMFITSGFLFFQSEPKITLLKIQY